MYRLPSALRKCRTFSFNWFSSRQGQRIEVICNAQFTLIRRALKIITDSPSIAAGAIVSLTLWRAFFMWSEVLHSGSKRAMRASARHHFEQLFHDIFDLPYVLMSMVMIVTVWRAPSLYKGIRTLVSQTAASERRRIIRVFVRQHFVRWLVDPLAFVAASLCVLSVYRAKNIFNAIKNSTTPLPQPIRPTAATTTTTNTNVDENPAPPPPSLLDSWQLTSFRELMMLCLDVPIPILIAACLWRAPTAYRQIKRCTGSWERQMCVLRNLFLTVKDIPVFAMSLVMLITVWRASEVKQMWMLAFENGIEIHSSILYLFCRYLIDIPFILLSLPAVFTLYRVPSMRNDWARHTTDKKRREMLAGSGVMTLLDIFTCIPLVLIAVTGIRFPYFLQLIRFKRLYSTKSACAYLPSYAAMSWEGDYYFIPTVMFTFYQLFLDVICFGQIAFNCGCLVFAPRMFTGMKKNVDKYRSSSRDFTKIDLLKEEDQEKLNASVPWYNNDSIFTAIREPVAQQFLYSLHMLPHIALLPLKLVGYLARFIVKILRKRISMSAVSRGSDYDPSKSFFIPFILDVADARSDDFFRLHEIGVIAVIGIVVLIPNEVAVALTCLNAVYLTLATWFSPLWKNQRLAVGFNSLGCVPDGLWHYLHNIIVVTQISLFPFYFTAQGFLLVLPSLSLFAPLLAAVDSFHYNPLPRICSHFLFSNLATIGDLIFQPLFPFLGGLIITQLVWGGIVLASWHCTHKLCKNSFKLYNPRFAALWLIQQILSGRVWRFYVSILGKFTTFCYRRRRWLLVFGELAMFPGVVLWSCWPALISRYYLHAVPTSYIFLASAGLSLVMLYRSKGAVMRYWRPPPGSYSEVPAFKIVSVLPKLARYNLEDHRFGLEVDIVGETSDSELLQKPASLKTTIALKGENFWLALGKAVPAMVILLMKQAMPFALYPNRFKFLPKMTGDNDKTVRMQLQIGMESDGWLKVNGKVLFMRLDALREKADDPSFDIVVEHGNVFSWGFEPRGVLFRIGLCPSLILNAVSTNIKIDGSLVDRSLASPLSRAESGQSDDDSSKSSKKKEEEEEEKKRKKKSEAAAVPPVPEPEVVGMCWYRCRAVNAATIASFALLLLDTVSHWKWVWRAGALFVLSSGISSCLNTRTRMNWRNWFWEVAALAPAVVVSARAGGLHHLLLPSFAEETSEMDPRIVASGFLLSTLIYCLHDYEFPKYVRRSLELRKDHCGTSAMQDALSLNLTVVTSSLLLTRIFPVPVVVTKMIFAYWQGSEVLAWGILPFWRQQFNPSVLFAKAVTLGLMYFNKDRLALNLLFVSSFALMETARTSFPEYRGENPFWGDDKETKKKK